MKKIDTEEFIRRAREKHGDKFDYSKSVYVNNSTDLEIYCTVCDNTFYSTPANHNHKTKAGGCPYCSGKIRTTESVIKQCKKIHGDKYIYDHIDYKGTKTKVKVECKKHGIFLITPSNLTHKGVSRGCPRCAKTLNKEDFINKAREVHGNKYNYDGLVFTSTTKKMIITCPDHGDFFQVGNSHLSGRGCQECAKIKIANARLSNSEEFIQKAKKIHKNKYKYDLVEYINNSTKVEIICRSHGIFWQQPSNHLLGRGGCIKCKKELLSNKFRDTKEKFIQKARKIHGNKYDYSLVEYVNNSTKVKIVCPKHGVFEQVPYSHVDFGCGCDLCKRPLVNQRGLTAYETHFKKLSEIGVECRRDPNDVEVLQAKCYKCGKFFSPSSEATKSKIAASKRTGIGERNLYCGSKCKQECLIYGFVSTNIDPRSKMYKKEDEKNNARNCKTNTLKEIQCDKKGYNYCEKCGDIIDVELHHTLEVVKFGKESINPASHMLLCAGCHTELHKDC